ncbi:MAG: hypothetical protein HYU43_09510 [Armatimonadetes bacterium]|nr:hypothetical protein [Armatimonadota bacterium]
MDRPRRTVDLDPIGGVWLTANLGYPARTIEENDRWKIGIDANGVTTKWWKGHYATPLQMEFAVRTFEDWKQWKGNLKLERFPVDPKVIEDSKRARNEGRFHYLTVDEPIWFALRILGHDHCLERMADEPDFVEDIVATLTDFGLARMEAAIHAGGQFDVLWLWSDLCYKNGMLFSPGFYRKRFLRYHRKIKGWCSQHRLPIVFHCDGDVRQFIPCLLEAGMDCVQPLEERCGNDVRELKKQFGRDICLFGNIGMDVLATGDRARIRHEVETKVQTAKVGGGYISHSDHSVPPTVSWDDYRFWLDLAHEAGRY